MKKRYLSAVIVCLLAITFLLSGCSAGKRTPDEEHPTMNVNVDKDGNTVYNGNEQLFYRVQDGETATVHFRIDAAQGSIAFDIQEKDDASVHQYRGTVTESCEFDVIIDTPDRYRICVTAKDFHGTYVIDWKTEQ